MSKLVTACTVFVAAVIVYVAYLILSAVSTGIVDGLVKPLESL